MSASPDPAAAPSPGAGLGATAIETAAAALDRSRDLIVVLDGDGTIVLTNAAWRAGAERRGTSDAVAGCGVNYFAVCEQSDGAEVSAGIRSVLSGERPRFEFEYPCHSATEDAWYRLEVVPLDEVGSGVVLTHTNITARSVATRQHGSARDVEPVTMLATTPAGVTGLARMLADAQSRGNALAVLTVTLSDLSDIESRHGGRSRDELVVQVVARVVRLTRAEDAMIRAATNQLVLFATVADAQGAEFLRARIADVLENDYLVGADYIKARVFVTATWSDRFSTLDSLLRHVSSVPVRTLRNEPEANRNEPGSRGGATNGSESAVTDDRVVSYVPLMVYSLPDGYLQAANAAARSLFHLAAIGANRLHARDIADPVDLRSITAALSSLSSGATDSYRARRTLVTADGPLELATSVRRLLVGAGALAVVLTLPVNAAETDGPSDDPFAAALVAGTIDGHGVIDSVSAAASPMETTLVRSLGKTLQLAAHPDEADLVDTMLESLRLRGSAAGVIRIPHAEQGWVDCQCQLFTITRHPDDGTSTESSVAAPDAYAFVLSANVSTASMVEKIARLEHHIRRIGSEVHAADLEVTVRAPVPSGGSAVLDALELTPRQRDIVERLARGQRVPSIAAELFISRSTVRNHLAQVYRLVGVHSQEELLNALHVT